MRHLVTLTTDFGTTDSYVAEVKAVLLSADRETQIVDVTHQIPAYDIRAAAFQLLRCYRAFPRGSCHLVVVDPGVGTERKCLYVRTAGHHFIGPDNGVLLWAVRDVEEREGTPAECFEIPVPPGTQPTFHGRDVFAPFAARVLRGELPARLTRLSALAGEPFPHARETREGVVAEVLAVDHFGNVVTSAPYVGDREREARVTGHRGSIRTAPNYGSIPKGQAALIRGSHGFWEISMQNASAARKLKLTAGKKVLLRPAP